jgi:hypothetical protein
VDGKQGKGGVFGGDGAQSGFGGGGAALGGAIFSDGAAVIIRNSTFTGNRVFRGEQGGPLADNGQDAGGAIFMLNGSLTVENSTVAGNFATGSGGGIQIYQLGSTPTSFTLLNTIIYGNSGLNECSIQANSVTSAGIVGNLIQNNDPLNPCLVNGAGVVSVSDPGLGLLQDNLGFTPTISITQGLAAWGTADASTSLATDQRGFPRPSLDGHGFDIGAFELCTPSNHLTGAPCRITVQEQTFSLTMQVSPAGGGTTSPPAGVTNFPINSTAVISETANPGFIFTGWSANVTDPTCGTAANPGCTSTTVVLNQDQTVTANFAPVTCVSDLAGVGTSGSALAPPRIDLTWTGIGNAGSYGVLRGTTSGGPYAQIGSATTTAFSDTSGLTNGSTYYYVLQPLDQNGIEICQSSEAGVPIPAPRHR